MRSPLWILNSILALLFIATLGFIFFKREKAPQKISLVVGPASVVPRKAPAVDLTRIYTNDLFGTYMAPVPSQPVVEKLLVLPPPPQPKPAPVPQPVQLNFLPPLAVTLRGIITSSNETDNFAIIASNKTKQEALYKVGDSIEDAELIRIAKNKVILIRANGQQETIFVSAQEAQSDQIFNPDMSWVGVIRKLSDFSYAIDPKAFTDHITSAAQFIDMLDITTAFRDGASIGCRIGQLAPQSIGYALGLNRGDIVTTVNNVPTTTTQNRVAIYQSLKTLRLGSTITVKLLRAQKEVTLSFVLQKAEGTSNSPLIQASEHVSKHQQPPALAQQTRGEVQQETAALLEKSSYMRPFVNDIKKQHRSAMLNYGGREALLQRMP